MAFLHIGVRGCSTKIKEMTYFAIVHSVLEYCAHMWHPYLKKDITNIKNVQCRAARFVNSDFHRTGSVTKMLKDRVWNNLADRRKDLRLALIFKIVKGNVVM